MREIKFKDFIKLNRGFDLPNDKMVMGDFPVVASTSIKGYHDEYKVLPPVVEVCNILKKPVRRSTLHYMLKILRGMIRSMYIII